MLGALKKSHTVAENQTWEITLRNLHALVNETNLVHNILSIFRQFYS